jgi:endonuclease III
MTIAKIHSILKRETKNYDVPVVDLISVQTDDPFKVLVATILSARTKDETTALAVGKLFKRAQTPGQLSRLSIKELEELIYPVGFYKTKARHLKQLPSALKQFGLNVPTNIDDLVTLPGVGRKTANLVMVLGHKKHGICVDTHVHRIMNRIGFIETKNPLQTEMTLREKLPKKYWKTINTLLVALGQNICRPISPKCSQCPISKHCEKKLVGISR